MSVKKTTQTTTDKILNSDIYDLTAFVDDIKKINIDGIDSDKETLLVGMYGYLGYEFTSLLQNSIVVASELANEAIPTRAKFDRNVITHALSLGVSKVASTAASMKVLIMFPEKALRNNMVDGKFTLKSSTAIKFGDFEYHTDYDINIYLTDLNSSTNGTNMQYVYTAHYDMAVNNPISDIDNEYLPPLSIFADSTDNMIVLITTLHQVEYQEIDEKIVGSDDINNKTLSFTFESQMSHFSIEVTENGSDDIISLVPVYDGLYNQEAGKYCYYQYINSNTIRIRFDPNSYQPRTNANVKIKLWTSQGASGNFEYSDDLLVRLTSDEYTNLYMIVKQRGEEGSTGGLDRKTVEELQKIIPKEALSRGCITTLTDLKNYFNSINNEDSVLHVFRKEDNILTRIYYTYCLMKDRNNNVIPTNTIPVFINGSSADEFSGKMYLESGTPIYYYKDDIRSTLPILKNNFIGYTNQDMIIEDEEYKWDNQLYNESTGLYYNTGDYNFLVGSDGEPSSPHNCILEVNSSIYFKIQSNESDPTYNKWYQGIITKKEETSYMRYKYYILSIRMYDTNNDFHSQYPGYKSIHLIIPHSISSMAFPANEITSNEPFTYVATPGQTIAPLGQYQYIVDSIRRVRSYTYNTTDSYYNFDSLILSEGDNIRFCTYAITDIQWKLGEVLSIVYKNNRIVGLTLLVHDVVNNTFDKFIYRLPTLADANTSLGNSLTNSDIISLEIISKFIYTSPLSIVLDDDEETDSNRINASYYLESINEERYLDFKCINSKSPLQYISSYVHVLRPSYLSTERYMYTIRIDLVPNIGTITDEMINRTQVVGVFYRDDNPICYCIADYDQSSDSDIMSFNINLFTKELGINTNNTDPDTIDDENRLYIGNKIIGSDLMPASDYKYKVYEVNESTTDSQGIYYPKTITPVYLDKNVTFRTYILYKYDESPATYQDDLTNKYRSSNGYTGIPLTAIIPHEIQISEPNTPLADEDFVPYTINDMTLTNVYETHDGINLFYDYSNLMNSYVTMLDGEFSSVDSDQLDLGYIINRAPMVRYFYFNNEDKINTFIKEMKRKILYVLDAIDPLECTFGLDFKFFNTYGPSNMYHITDYDGNISGLINNVALNITFRTKFYNEDSDRDSILPLIKNDIKSYLENLEDLDDIHFPNLTTEIETKYKEYVIFFEYITFNIYDANYQHIITDENMEMLTVVPEFLNVDTDDYTGLPRININVIS